MVSSISFLLLTLLNHNSSAALKDGSFLAFYFVKGSDETTDGDLSLHVQAGHTFKHERSSEKRLEVLRFQPREPYVVQSTEDIVISHPLRISAQMFDERELQGPDLIVFSIERRWVPVVCAAAFHCTGDAVRSKTALLGGNACLEIRNPRIIITCKRFADEIHRPGIHQVLVPLRRAHQAHEPPDETHGDHRIIPSVEMVTTRSGMSFPLASIAFLTAISSPPQQGTSIRTRVMDATSFALKIMASLSL